jgi:N-acetylmuramoyl-L-alanine amidase
MNKKLQLKAAALILQHLYSIMMSKNSQLILNKQIPVFKKGVNADFYVLRGVRMPAESAFISNYYQEE